MALFQKINGSLVKVNEAKMNQPGWDVFAAKAPSRLRRFYDKLEESNFHTDNAFMVKEFERHIVSGGSPDSFTPTIASKTYYSWDDKRIKY